MKCLATIFAVVAVSQPALACLHRTPPAANRFPAYVELYANIQNQFARIKQTKTRTARGLLVHGLASTFIDSSNWIDSEGGCPQELMLYIEKELVDQEGKILLGRGTISMLETLELRSMFVPYEPKYRIARKIYDATLGQFSLDAETGNPGQDNPELLKHYAQGAKIMAARIINRGNFVYNIPSVPPLLVSIIKQEKDPQIFLQLDVAFAQLLDPTPFGGDARLKVDAIAALLKRSQTTLQIEDSNSAYPSDVEFLILKLLGNHASALGQKEAVKRHLLEIIEKEGAYPLTGGVDSLEKRLLVAARHSLLNLQ